MLLAARCWPRARARSCTWRRSLAIFATANAGAYSASKAGVAMLSRSLAMKWAAQGVRSNAVCPGMTLTPMTVSAYTSPGQMAARTNAVPAGRIGTPEDIAKAVPFLASDRSDHTNGTVDGGFTRKPMRLIPQMAQ